MGTKIGISFFVLLLAYVVRRYYSPPVIKSPIVHISTGRVEGLILKSRDGRDFFGYLGIRYAQSPVGDLRFEPPEPLLNKSDAVLDATVYGSKCIQINLLLKVLEGSEDCLFVNVYTPKLKPAKLPVMVWIHGGLFAFGAGSEYLPDCMLDEDVVLVTLNYRLSSFGFLNTGDGTVRGNMGLKDRNMALRWVKENIAGFGGDNNQVTIFGESSGGVSVHHHILSPMSKGLFQKAIAQSGLATMPWAIYTTPAVQARRFANQLKCNPSDPKEMVKCLKSKTALEIVNVHLETASNTPPLISIYVPTIEKDIADGKTFIVQNPMTLIESGNFHKVPFMTGINNAEGTFITATVMTNKTIAGLLNTKWSETVIPLLFLPEYTDLKLLEKVRDFYVGGNGKLELDNPFKHFINLTNMFSDWIFIQGFHTGMIGHAKQLSPSNPLFLYYYTHEAEFSLTDIKLALVGDYHPMVEITVMKIRRWVQRLIGQEMTKYGAAHFDEVLMMLGSSIPKDSKDYKFSKQIVKTWALFAKTDVKTLTSLEFLGEKWPPQEPNKPLKYMQLDNSPKLISEPNKERLAFWDTVKLI